VPAGTNEGTAGRRPFAVVLGDVTTAMSLRVKNCDIVLIYSLIMSEAICRQADTGRDDARIEPVALSRLRYFPSMQAFAILQKPGRERTT
jgi:hypothetical protein